MIMPCFFHLNDWIENLLSKTFYTNRLSVGILIDKSMPVDSGEEILSDENDIDEEWVNYNISNYQKFQNEYIIYR